ncbi:MAG TPA: type II toxin-antitoxin system prevent-host-death family antitoxin [Verrucomicrobiae bacterium]
MKTKLPLYRQRKPAMKLAPESSGPMVMREVAAMPGVGPIISVRAAKAHLSALLELVAGGREITITSDGEPKAVLSPVGKHKTRKVFTGMGDYLMKQPVHRGLSADEAVNLDRDARGW